jgi:DNA-binding winged helix-turn-helix (wHTH) protein
MRVQFGEFTFDAAALHLGREGRSVRVADKALAVLRLLLERRPEMVTKEELLQRIWPDKPVEEASLSMAIAQLRRALADDAQEPRFIRTHFRKGYAFVGDVLDPSSRPAEGSRVASRFSLSWKKRRFALFEGENTIGRSPQSSVWIDHSGVSRTHAAISISGSVATIEDRSSTNGTFLRGSRVASPTSLANHDVIRVGTVDVTFQSDEVETVRVPQKRPAGPRGHTHR